MELSAITNESLPVRDQIKTLKVSLGKVPYVQGRVSNIPVITVLEDRVYANVLPNEWHDARSVLKLYDAAMTLYGDITRAYTINLGTRYNGYFVSLERANPEFGQSVKELTSCDMPVNPHSVFRRLIPPKYSPVCGYITLWVGKDCLTGEYTSTVYLVDEADTKLSKKFPTVEEAMSFVLDAPEPATEEWFDQLYADDWMN